MVQRYLADEKLLNYDHIGQQRMLLRPSMLRRPLGVRLALLLAVSVIFLLGFISSSLPASRGLHTVVGTRNRWGHVPQWRRDRALEIRVFNKLLQHYYPASTTDISQADEFHERKLNYAALDRLAHCIETQTCGPGEEKIVLFGVDQFAFSHRPERTSGENIWARSTIKAFGQMNYTMLYGWSHTDTLFMYQHLGDMVDIVLWGEKHFNACVERNESNYARLEKSHWPSVPGNWQTGKRRCIYSEEYPEGVPYWKSFVFKFWAGPVTPLGSNWTVSPEDYGKWQKGNYYLGYSTEETCMQVPYIAAKDRKHTALILGKKSEYFGPEKNMFPGSLKHAADQVPSYKGEKFRLTSTAGVRGEALAEPGIETLGMMSMSQWRDHLAHSKALVGIGQPPLSPSPLDALCAGVPFINPIKDWDVKRPMNRSRWITQTNTLLFEQEPYVYHVFKNNATDLAGALTRAAQNPIERYIPPDRRWENVFARHKKFATTDWQAEAKKYVLETYGDDNEYKYLYMPEH